jgi:Arc/MetJ-type ribon-helix-helix transcriptional regulator
MTIELTREQEKQVRGFVESGQYESVQAFIDEAITEAYSRTEEFITMIRAKLAESQRDIEAGRVVTVPNGKLSEILQQYRNGTLKFDSDS